MKHLCFFLFISALLNLNAFAFEEVKWSGEAGLRYYSRNVNDGLESKNSVTGRDTSLQRTKTLDFRALVTATGNAEPFEWHFGLRTKNTANDDYVLFNQNQDLAVGIESAYLRHNSSLWNGTLGAAFGRQKGAFLFEPYSENLFAEATRFDGLGWFYESGIFSLGLGQYSLGGRSNGTVTGSSYTTTDHANSQQATNASLAFLISVQPSLAIKLSEKVLTGLSVGFYHWGRTDSF